MVSSEPGAREALQHDRKVRHFTYIDDIVWSLIYAWGCNYNLVNATNPEEISTLHLAELVKCYTSLEIELVEETRDFDSNEQSVNESIYTVPLHYTPVFDGINRIFNGIAHEQTQ